MPVLGWYWADAGSIGPEPAHFWNVYRAMKICMRMRHLLVIYNNQNIHVEKEYSNFEMMLNCPYMMGLCTATLAKNLAKVPTYRFGFLDCEINMPAIS